MTAVSPLRLGRWALSGACAAGWLCAIWRLAVGEGGAVEASVTAGGWGLSVLPVHVAHSRSGSGSRPCGGPAARRRTGPRPSTGGRGMTGPPDGTGVEGFADVPGSTGESGPTRASRRRRWGGGSARW